MRSTQILWNGVCIAVLLTWNTNVCGISSYEVDDISIHDSEKTGKPLAENTKAEKEGIMTENSIENEELQLQYGQRNNFSLQIIKGKLATLGQFPWQAALTLFKKRGGSTHCGGCLIRTNLVLTAAHCLVDHDNIPKVEKVIVLLGTLTRRDASTKFVSTDFGIHSKYQRKPRIINDIAYVRLPSRVKLSKNIKTIQLPSGSMLKKTFAGEMGVASGYGFANDGTSGIDRPLYYVDVRILDNKECKKFWPKIDSSRVCIRGENGGETCKGDSGGPVIVYINKKPILIGLDSHGETGTTNCNKTKPTVFTRVTAFIKWINRIEDKSVLCGDCKTNHKTDFFDIEYKTNLDVIMTV